ncbi:MAG: metal-dependent hydrolase [Thermoflexales bacterium]|nr:metal-dependent hydrolase [Thermoflexales bacterium]
MKGITHFLTGVALATFFPEVVRQAADGSLLPVLGGVAGILPDTLDFKFARYFERYDLEIDPGPNPDPRRIADALVGAMRRAYETGQSRNIMLHTIRLGADLWRQYIVRFDPRTHQVAVRIGPVVNTGQVPFPGSEPEGLEEVRIPLDFPLVETYDEEYKIDIFSGPSFRFERVGDRLRVHFLDWHRRWSHSLTLAVLLGLGVAALAALIEVVGQGAVTRTPLWAGLITTLGFAGHILEDQLGFMGSNLFYPFTKGRMSGLRLLRSGDAIPNFLTVWLASAVMLFNLDRFSASPRLAPLSYLSLAVGLPLVVLGGFYALGRRQARPRPREFLRQRDIVAEAEEVEVG